MQTTTTLSRTELTQQYLAHHGIKGQRWGVRRYQNPDGSLTKAGKKRRGVGDSDDEKKDSTVKNYLKTTRLGRYIRIGDKIKETGSIKEGIHENRKFNQEMKEAVAKRRAEKEAKKTGIPVDETPEQREARKQAVLRSGDANDILAFRGQLTNQELQSAYQRINLETQLSSISKAQTKSTWDKITTIANRVTTITAAANAGMTVYNVVAKINNSFNPKFNIPAIDGGTSMAAREAAKTQSWLRNADAKQVEANLSKLSTQDLRDYMTRTMYAEKLKNLAG